MESEKYLIHQSDAWLIKSCLLGEEEYTDMSHVDGVDDGVGYGVIWQE